MSERLEAERRIRALIEEAESLRAVVGEAPGEMGIVGRSAGVRGVCNSIRQVAPTDATVLILGETGTGKELVARAIHEASARREEALVRVNCAAIPESLIESEFFGHEKGAFTGATARRDGRFAQADGGTLFLDEVGELPLDLQAKLLRVIQEGEFEPLGGTKTRKVDVRVVAATNRSLEDEISAGRFREDLYYRLNVFPISVPALRERGNDICLLAEAFVQRFADRMGRRFDSLTDQDRQLLKSYSWPGNVRELQNVIERALILSSGHALDLSRAMPRLDDEARVEPMEAASADHRQARILINRRGNRRTGKEEPSLGAGEMWMEDLRRRGGFDPDGSSALYDCLQNEDPRHTAPDKISANLLAVRVRSISFCRCCQQCLEIWRLRLPGDDTDLNF